MAKKASNIIYVVLVVFTALLLSFVLLVPKKTREGFETITGVTSIDIYKTANNQADFLDQYESKVKLGLLDDRSKLLHMRSCYQIATDELDIQQRLINLTNNNSIRASRLGPMYTNDFGEVENRIREDIRLTCDKLRSFTKDPNASLEGEIYVIILQAPFYQSQDQSMMSVQFNISSYQFLPINIAGVGNIATLRERPVDLDIFIIYGKYRKNMDVRNIAYQPDSHLSKYRTTHEQCFIKCQGAPNYVCGCTTGDVPRQNYKSNCVTSRIGATTVEEKNQAIPHTFPIMYIVNRAHPEIQGLVSII